MVFYKPDARDTSLLPHDPFKALVAPRPIGWISSLGPEGHVNLAPLQLLQRDRRGTAHAGLLSSRLVAPPRVAASPCAMECRVVHQVRLHDLEGRPVDQYIVIGQVVGVHLDETIIGREGVDTAALRPIARCGGPGDYTVVDRVFQMFRPGS